MPRDVCRAIEAGWPAPCRTSSLVTPLAFPLIDMSGSAASLLPVCVSADSCCVTCSCSGSSSFQRPHSAEVDQISRRSVSGAAEGHRVGCRRTEAVAAHRGPCRDHGRGRSLCSGPCRGRRSDHGHGHGRGRGCRSDLGPRVARARAACRRTGVAQVPLREGKARALPVRASSSR